MGFVVYLFGAPRIYFSKRPPLTYLNTSPVNRGDRKEWESLSWGSDQNQFSNIFHPIQPLNKKNFWGRDRRRVIRLTVGWRPTVKYLPNAFRVFDWPGLQTRPSGLPMRRGVRIICVRRVSSTTAAATPRSRVQSSTADAGGPPERSRRMDATSQSVGGRSVGRSAIGRTDGAATSGANYCKAHGPYEKWHVKHQFNLKIILHTNAR